MAGPCSLRVSLAQVHLGGTGPGPAKLLGPGHTAGSKSQGWLSVTGLALETKRWVVRGRGSTFSANLEQRWHSPDRFPLDLDPKSFVLQHPWVKKPVWHHTICRRSRAGALAESAVLPTTSGPGKLLTP